MVCNFEITSVVGVDVRSERVPKYIEISGTAAGCFKFQVEIPNINYTTTIERKNVDSQPWSVSAVNESLIECGREIRIVVRCLDEENSDCSLVVSKVIECESRCPDIPIELIVLDENGQKVTLEPTECLESQQYEVQIRSPPHDPSYIYTWAVNHNTQYLSTGPNNRSITCMLDNDLSISLTIVKEIENEICVYSRVISLTLCLPPTGFPDCDSTRVKITAYRPETGQPIKDDELTCLGPGQYQLKANVEFNIPGTVQSYHWYVDNQEVCTGRDYTHDFTAETTDIIYVEAYVETSSSEICRARDSITFAPYVGPRRCSDLIVDVEVFDINQVQISSEQWNCLAAGNYSLHAILIPEDLSASYTYTWKIENQVMGDGIIFPYTFDELGPVSICLDVIRQTEDGEVCEATKIISFSPCSEIQECNENYTIDLQVLRSVADGALLVTNFDCLGAGYYMFNAAHEFTGQDLTYAWYVNDVKQEGVNGSQFNYTFDGLNTVSVQVEIILIESGNRCRVRESVILTACSSRLNCDDYIDHVVIRKRSNGTIVDVDNSRCLSRGTYEFSVMLNNLDPRIPHPNDIIIWKVGNSMQESFTFTYDYDGENLTTIHVQVRHIADGGSYCFAEESVSLMPCIATPICTDSSIEFEVSNHETNEIIHAPHTKCFEPGVYRMRVLVTSAPQSTHELLWRVNGVEQPEDTPIFVYRFDGRGSVAIQVEVTEFRRDGSVCRMEKTLCFTTCHQI